MIRRATRPEAKAQRREDILGAAALLFESIGYDNISMSLVADRAGLAKGTPYRYFRTREAIFLALYSDELGRWDAALQAELTKVPASQTTDTLRIAGLFADLLDRHPRLPALAAILHTTLERNIDIDTAAEFKRRVSHHLSTTGPMLETRLGFLAPGDGARLLLRLHSIMIGTWQSATPAPVIRKLLGQEEFAGLRVDFSEEFENSIFLLLEGWKHQAG